MSKFVASTARDALHKVKEILGPDAINVKSRTAGRRCRDHGRCSAREMAHLESTPIPLRDIAAAC